jgi:hypothetical protein
MSIEHIVPGLLGVLVGVLLSVITWSIWKMRGHTIAGSVLDAQANVLLWLLMLAAFALGVFATYALLRL